MERPTINMPLCVRKTLLYSIVISAVVFGPLLQADPQADNNAARLSGASTNVQATASPSAGLQQALSKVMQDVETMPLTGDVDADFASMMVKHHQGAIAMAKIELANAKDAEMRRTAQRMIEEQTKEIDKLQEWRERHGQAMSHSTGQSTSHNP